MPKTCAALSDAAPSCAYIRRMILTKIYIYMVPANIGFFFHVRFKSGGKEKEKEKEKETLVHQTKKEEEEEISR